MNVRPMVGEPLALDVVNTRVRAPGQGDVDLLATENDVRSWLALQADRLGASVQVEQVEQAALLDLRDVVAALVDSALAGTDPDPRHLAALNAALAAAPVRTQLTWAGTDPSRSVERGGTASQRVLAAIAESAVDVLVASGGQQQLRRCSGSGCQVVFLATNSRRQWCSPALCGNRERAARHYRRHKGASPAE